MGERTGRGLEPERDGQLKPSDTGVKTGANTSDLKGIADVGKLHTVPTDFVDKYPLEWFIQSSLQTDYVHGKDSSVTATRSRRA